MKKIWMSPCSAHMSQPDKDCDICALGHWKNAWRLKVSNVIFKVTPGLLWRWWANRNIRKKRREKIQQRT